MSSNINPLEPDGMVQNHPEAQPGPTDGPTRPKNRSESSASESDWQSGPSRMSSKYESWTYSPPSVEYIFIDIVF